jgi:hypothetical protein
MVIQALLWILLPGLVYGLLAALLPDPGPPPWWRRRLVALRDRLSARRQARRQARREARRTARRMQRAPTAPASAGTDPFEVLAVQLRLAAVAEQLRVLEDHPDTWALAHRLDATLAAYDALLGQARRLAGVADVVPTPGPGVRRRTEPERLADELALAERGWFW